MSDNPTDLQAERLVPLRVLAQEMSRSEREMRRDIPSWPGFPEQIDMGHRTKRYSYLAFQNWLKDFIKQEINKPKDQP